MAKLVKYCPVCKEKAIERSHKLLPSVGLRIIELECGHSYTEKISAKKNWEELEAKFGKKDKLFNYQGEGYEFARESGFRALIGDVPGLGKTLQTLACIILHPELLPCLIVVKSKLKLQYMKQVIRWGGVEMQPQIISDSKDEPSSIFPVIITTYDLLWRRQKKLLDLAEKKETELRLKHGISPYDVLPDEIRAQVPSIESPFKTHKFQCIILDECQQIKNPLSKRAQQVRALCEHIPHVLASSGTAIKNHAGEYFTILNILRPEKFPDYKQYLNDYCDWYDNGRVTKVGGIRDIVAFKEATKDFIIRRTEDDVQLELPEINRKYVECDFASKTIEKEYQAMAEEFADFYNENEGDPNMSQHILARMAKMRHKAGVNKIPFITELVTDFLLDTEPTDKIVIFAHHLDVIEMLNLSITKAIKEEGIDCMKPLLYVGQDMNRLDDAKSTFIRDKRARVLIASTLSSGEGVDGLQEVCHNCIMAERQWNPANEEQTERRFKRIGAIGKSVNANYVLSSGTIDEYFTELVEHKRAIVTNTLDGKEVGNWSEQGLMAELAEILARKGSKKWSL